MHTYIYIHTKKSHIVKCRRSKTRCHDFIKKAIILYDDRVSVKRGDFYI